MIKFKNLTPEFKEIYEKMDTTFLILEKDFRGLSTGRASPSLIESVKIDLHGTFLPLYQASTISVVNNQTLSVRLWDKNITKKAEKAIIDSNLGVSVYVEEDIINVKIPPLSEERRKELSKLSLKYAEKVKIMLRSIRKDYNDKIKNQEKGKEISKDEAFTKSKTLQSILDLFTEKVDKKVESKTKEIMQI